MELKKSMTLQFETGVECEIDLARMDMDKRQSEIVHKLMSRAGQIVEVGKEDTCEESGRRCPALEYLDEEEFEAIRDLKARLGTGGPSPVAAGIIVNFCLDVVVV